MPPKFDPTQIAIIIIRCTGGEAPAGASLAPRLGPLGVPAKKVGEDIAKFTKAYAGLRVTVKLTIQNRAAEIEIVPTASTLVISALKEPKRDRKKTKNIKHDGNLSLDQIIDIAKTMRHKSFANEFAGTVLEILGTASSVGCTVEHQDPREIQRAIKAKDIEIPDYEAPGGSS